MNILEAVQLFTTEMKNEIYHNVSDETLQDTLIKAVEETAETVLRTYNAEKK